MPKEDLFTMKGVVKELLPNTTFNVELENGSIVNAYASGKIRRFRIKIILGDDVDVEMSSYDLTKGRIMKRTIK